MYCKTDKASLNLIDLKLQVGYPAILNRASTTPKGLERRL